MSQNSRTVKVGLIQMQVSADKSANIKATELRIREAVARGAQIICLQELFATEYFCKTQNHDFFALAEPVSGNTGIWAQKLSAELKIVIIASFFEKRTEGLYHNTALVTDADGCLLGIYRKSHIPDDPGFNEKFYFTPGDTGYKVFNTRFAKVGVLICWDQWYPEAARITALKGAEVLFYPTAIGWLKDEPESIYQEQYDAWQTVQRGHAIANGLYVVAVNRCGTEEETVFWGGSFVSSPFGKILYQASVNEEVIVSDLDLSLIDATRTTWPFLRDRRIDNYNDIVKRFID